MKFLTQTGRFLKCTTKLGADKLIATHFSSKEALSELFLHSFRFISSEKEIDPNTLLKSPISLEIHNGGKEPRYFHGIINHFSAGAMKNGMREYTATAMPSFGFLQHASNYRIFRGESSLEIFEKVCKEHGIFDIEMAAVKGVIPKRQQCTQFNETTLAFLQRILSEDGIFFVFKHTKDKHILQLANQGSIHAPCPEKEIIYDPGSERGKRHRITSWHRDYQFYSGKYAHCDFNHKDPGTSLHAANKTDQTPVKLPKATDFENFQHNGGHDEHGQGEKLATYRFEAAQAQHNIVHGSSNHACFSVGNVFDLTQHLNPKEVGSYTLVEINHTAFDESYLAGTSAASGKSQDYKNSFSCIPKGTPYRAPLLPKPTCIAPQTAIVVGNIEKDPSGKVSADDPGGFYTNEFGSVKVRFHWIRRGNEEAKSEPATAWARVAQSWAGPEYGTFYLPRIGQEVVVQFINGDPDLPLITGCLYNAKNKPPFKLPANATQSGIKTRSLKAGVAEWNELRFEDKRGKEEIYIHAQKDFNQEILHDLTIVVDNDYNHETKHDENHTVGNDIVHKIGNDITQTIGRDLDINIGNTGVVEANFSLTFKVGTSSIQLLPHQVIINGEDVWLNDKQIIFEKKSPVKLEKKPRVK